MGWVLGCCKDGRKSVQRIPVPGGGGIVGIIGWTQSGLVWEVEEITAALNFLPQFRARK